MVINLSDRMINTTTVLGGTVRTTGSQTVAGTKTFTGALLISDGTVGSPAIAFSDDANTGVFSSTNDTISLTAGGVEVIRAITAASAVNYLQITPSATGADLLIDAVGTDSDIDLAITPKASGQLVLDGLRWPAADGSNTWVLQTDGSGNLSFVALPSSGLANIVEDTTPQLGGQLDVNGKAIGDGTLELLEFVETGAALNHIGITNAATGNGPIIGIGATGTEANVDLNLASKGTGIINALDNFDVTGNITVSGTVDGKDVATLIADIVEDTTPQLGGQLDVNGNAIGDGTLELLEFVETGSALNHIGITNAATGNGPIIGIGATGTEANVDLNFASKGTGIINALDNFDVTGNITVSGTVDTRNIADDGSKLDGIETSATADQTTEEIQDAAWGGSTLSGTQTLINVTYQDGTDDVDFVVDNDLSNYSNATSAFLQDIVTDTTPQLGGQLDVNGNAIGDGTLELLEFVETGAALNHIGITNAATGNGPTIGIGATGTEANVDLNILPKGTGNIVLDGLAWPSADGSNTWVLTTDGGGNLSFAAQAGGGLANVVEDTTPQLGGQLDVNGKAIGDGTLELLEFVETGSALNHIGITNAATGNGPIIGIGATGTEANVDLNLASKGTGIINALDNFDVTGNITVSGNVDGKDISTLIATVVEDTTPQLGGQLDVNGKAIGDGTLELLEFVETGSALNHIGITNAAAGNGPIIGIGATGTETDVDLNITPKGTGNVVLDGLAWPNADGGADEFLKTDGSGNLSFAVGVAGISNVVEDTTPQLGGQLDVNGKAIGDGTLELLEFVETGSALNHIGITNAATGNGPIIGIGATGTETNVDLNFASKGSGTINALDNFDVTGNITVSGTVDGKDIATLIADIVEDTTPQLGGQLDINGNALGDGTLELLEFVETGTALNHIGITNAATGNGPTIGIGATGTEDDVDLNFAAKGTGVITFASNMNGIDANGPSIDNVAATATVPNIIPDKTDPNTGVGASADDQLSLIAGGIEGLRLATASSHTFITNEMHAGLTAGTTQTQAGGLDLLSSYNQISIVATANNTVVLPPVSAGAVCEVINDGANTMRIYPASGDNLGEGVDTLTTLEPGGVRLYRGKDTTNWTYDKKIGAMIIRSIEAATDTAIDTDIVGDIHVPYRIKITEVIAVTDTAGTGSTSSYDVNNGSSIFSTVITIDDGETSSETAAAAAVISSPLVAPGDLLTIDIDSVGSSTAAKGLQIIIKYERL